MAKKSKRGSGPRPGSNRAERVAARKARQAAAASAPARPFAGLSAECDLVALRAFVASATVAVTPRGEGVGTNAVSLATILPGAVQALTRDAGDTGVEGLVGLQTEFEPADVTAELAGALLWASSAEAGEPYAPLADEDAPDLVDVLGADATLDITLHEDFGWWFSPEQDVSPDIAAMVEQASESILPTARISGDLGGAPWWVDAGERAHVRWVRPESEDDLMTALARLHAADKLTLGEGSRFAGSFRTHGLLVPVFDLDNEMHPDEWIEPCARFEADLSAALAETGDLTAAQRRSRDGIRGRQVTLR
ncbi:DUF5926 family protein [Williamsia deligens]|uniref:DUF5926 family protein n=1 Tax=Williamsia deligens TaxID=321325 RepID=A0ABW3G5G0_9NOCA|nr:DUF5926 family protein [Williamsia deligens]MCP2193921.1 hypothetical protein [Williamsia deligens]